MTTATRLTKPPLSKLVALIRRMERRRWDDGACGAVTITSAEEAEILAAVLRDPDDYPCEVSSGDPDDVAVGKTYEITLRQPRLGLGYLFPELTDLLAHPRARAGDLGKAWYVFDLDWAHDETVIDISLRYRKMRELVQLLVQCADYTDKESATFVFLRGERIDIPIHYTPVALTSLDTQAVDDLLVACGGEDGHTKQRREILATSIGDMTKDLAPDLRFGHVIANLPSLLQSFHDGYRLFASSFSFEKIRDQMEALRIDYTGRIHKTLSDIQGQLLGIPVATIVVATQMKEAAAPGPAMWANVAVLAGSFIFMMLLAASINNQWQTLNVLAEEVTRQEAAAKAEHADIADRFEGVFRQLNGRLIRQYRTMGVVLGIGCVSLVLSFVMFWALTKPALSIFF